MKEIIQGLKTKIETIKNTQTKGILEIETIGKQSGTTNASINSRIQEMKTECQALKI